LDADLYFFSSPEPLFDELGAGSILMIEHRFSAANSDHGKYGRFNVGYMTFRNDDSGRKCLEWWRERCIEWCYDRLEETRFADQKYLDAWPKLFNGVVVSTNSGANLAPWNIDRHRITTKNRRLCSDENEVIFFHFAGIKVIQTLWIEPGVSWYFRYAIPRVVRSRIFLPYLRSLRAVTASMRQSTANTRRAATTTPANSDNGAPSLFLIKWYAILLPRQFVGHFYAWITGRLFFSVGRFVL